MAGMTLRFNDDDGVMRFDLSSDDSKTRAVTTLQDTEDGVDIKTTITSTDGVEKVVVDRLDRRVSPLQMMMGAWEEFNQAILHNAQAAFNHSRYERLKREGKPLNQQTMCMCGQHTAPEWAEVPFQGGIVGVADIPAEDAPAPQQGGMSQEDQEKVRALLDWMPEDEQEAA